ncbi:MAG TPA: hypothetical protein VM054_03915 [bacterium]|nr:hypothetical protein [bacterium]
MVENILVKEYREEGSIIVKALLKHSIPVEAAFWSYYGLYERWEFYIVSSWADKKGINKTYGEIYDVREELDTLELLSFTDIKLIGLSDSLYKQYKDVLKQHQEKGRKQRRTSSGNLYSGPDYQFYSYNIVVIKQHALQ